MKSDTEGEPFPISEPDSSNPIPLAAFRAQQGEVMRMACRLDPRTGFQMAGEWLKYQLAAPVDIGPMNCKLPEEQERQEAQPPPGAPNELLCVSFEATPLKIN